MLNLTSESKSCFSRASLKHSGGTTFEIALFAKRLLSPYAGFIIWYEQELRRNVFTVSVYRIYSKSAALYKRRIMFNSEMRLPLND